MSHGLHRSRRGQEAAPPATTAKPLRRDEVRYLGPPVPVGDAVANTEKGTRRRRQLLHVAFLLVNFFTATRNSSVCMQSMMASRSASSCRSTGVTWARWISALV